MMRAAMRPVVLAALVAGCGAEGAHSDGGSDATSGDAPSGCMVYLTFDPPAALAGPSTQIRAIANVANAGGVLAYQWMVTAPSGQLVVTQPAHPDGSQVMFAAPDAGPYQVSVRVDGASPPCLDTTQPFQVDAPGANMKQYRLRVIAPPSAAPPQERLVLVKGAANAALDEVPVDPGVIAVGDITAGAAGVPAYLRFIPLGARDAYVEAFTSATGAYSVRVLNAFHDVLVVPTVPGIAPQLIRNWTPQLTSLQLVAGAALTGTVRVAGAPIAGAKVQITVDGVPSTLATTAGDGTFTVRAVAALGAPATVDVTPPPASGLPRIAATATFALGTSIDVAYAPTTLRDLAGTTVRRDGAAVPSAQVMLVGTLATAATVTAGAAVTVPGTVRLAATANASGQLPTLRAPAAQLSAAITVAPGDVALAPVDLRTTVPATLTAAPMVEATTTLKLGTATLPGAVIEAVPAGALALAGVPGVRVVAGAGGIAQLPLAAGASYALHLSDPQARAAPVPPPTVTSGTIASTYTLAPALKLTGTLQLAGSANPLGNASLQVLCTECTGVARSVPLGEASSFGSGAFAVAVPDPGAM